jgi:hypothetical protein
MAVKEKGRVCYPWGDLSYQARHSPPDPEMKGNL